MAISPLPAAPDEQARLQELYALHILDTPAEERFDRYTRLVADVLGVPTATISLVAKDRQWFKSAVGLEVTEIDLEVSFCTHALPSDYLEIPDARADARFCDNALVTGAPFIRFYAGAVLHGPTGQPLGTLCVIDTRARRLSEPEKARLIAFAGLVEQEINLHQRFKTLASDLQRAAFYDPVTGLPENGLMETYLTHSLGATRHPSPRLAVVHIQLTNFETLTALDGQRGGDIILQTVAKRLQQCVRPTDHIGRLGSDRFLVILPGLDRFESMIDERLRQLVRHVAAPVQVGAAWRSIKLVAGISRYPDDATTASALLDRARSALRYACVDERARVFNFYSREMQESISRRHDQVQRLANALEAGALQQVYQPIIDCQRGELVAVEALARWHDAVYGDVSPGEFIPLIEADADMRRALTRASLASACRQLAAWQRQYPHDLRITVNIPGGELYRDDFADLIRATLREYDVPPDRLVLELTEQSLITDLNAAVATIDALRALGIRFAIDDFGTGYSSLRYLKKLPLDTVKIDRSFIRDIVSDRTTRELTRAILAIARTLGLTVVAEGIENADQHAMLQHMGCDYAQGFLFSRPVPARAIERWLRCDAAS